MFCLIVPVDLGMTFKREIKELFARGHESHLRNISVDCVIFGFHGGELKVLLLKALYSEHWALPGGFVGQDEDIDESANRVLQQRTGLSDIYLQQFRVFGEAGRATQKMNRKILSEIGIKGEKSWIFERFVTVGYYALVDFLKVKPASDHFSSGCEWFNVYELPQMMMDHDVIVAKALDYLRFQLNYHPVGNNLLPEKFTMPELQKLYETILGRNLDRRNFQRKILGVGILKRLQERKSGLSHKAPYYYKFDLRKYQKALQSGMGFQL
ncbi:NUDIX hydrolase [Flavihumibacter fluvii]|uniref:NUDIX hydrolase n=1 Tax=Flavihumibacter fluvii TaxID=2838157 RepID=UPI001BDDFA06|nr:NUDIX domain-containing protein [Flavihumibacter fluvii]ULQ52647.1 NUDIX domain-containing protein [Flavihumibacter fluvii]